MTDKQTHICPSLLIECKGEKGYSPKALKQLFDGQDVSSELSHEHYDNDDIVDTIIENVDNISLSGAQVKYSLLVENSHMRFTKEHEQGLFILKPRPGRHRHRNFFPANEHLTMQLASQVYGIQTAPNGMCFFGDGMPAYFVRRFDILNGNKLQKEDFASLAGVTKRHGGSNFKYENLAYEGFAQIIDKYSSTPQVDKMRFFELLLFNFVFCNGDAHLKNFSLLEDGKGKFRLSPAYDLMNTLLHINDSIFAMHKGLFNDIKPQYITGSTFRRFGLKIGLPGRIVDNLLDKYCKIYPSADKLVEKSFLSEELKGRYKEMYKSRINSYLSIR